MKTMFLAATVAALLLAATATAATDPRVCGQATPGGQAKHAYWCAKAAATDAVRVTMANRQHVNRWYAPTSCTQAGTNLRWRCTTSSAGELWNVTVVFTHTPSGWRAAVRLS